MKKNNLALSTLFSSIFLFQLNAQVPNYIPANGLMGWWPFNGNAVDESGNGNNGIVTGAVLTSDRFNMPNMAYSFDGDGDYIDCGNAANLNIIGDITISAWIYANQFDIQHGIVSKYGLYDLVTDANFSVPPLDKIRWNAGNTSGFLFSNYINSNQWLHIVAVYNQQSGRKIYLNGQIFATDALTGIVSPNNTYNLYLGSHQPFNLSYWSWAGKLDDIGIWNRSLSDCEVQNLYMGTLSVSSISAGSDQIICKGDSVTLTAVGASSFSWDNNVIDGQPFIPLMSSNYVVSGSDIYGCPGSDTVLITVNESTFSSQTQTSFNSFTWPINGQTYTQSGTYTQVLTNAAGCDSTITLNLELSFTGMNTLSNTNIVIAPNPVNDYVQVMIPESLIGQTFILMDNSGRTILEGTFMQKEHKIDLKHLAVGVYVLKIHDGTEQTFRILKN
jgi:hypothetical protein